MVYFSITKWTTFQLYYTFSRRNVLLHADGSVEVTGKIQSNASGNRIIVDPILRSINMLDVNNRRVCEINFQEGASIIQQRSFKLDGSQASYLSLTTEGGLYNTGGLHSSNLTANGLAFYYEGNPLFNILSDTGSGKIKINSKEMPERRLNLESYDWYIDFPSDGSDGYIRVKK